MEELINNLSEQQKEMYQDLAIRKTEKMKQKGLISPDIFYQSYFLAKMHYENTVRLEELNKSTRRVMKDVEELLKNIKE